MPGPVMAKGCTRTAAKASNTQRGDHRQSAPWFASSCCVVEQLTRLVRAQIAAWVRLCSLSFRRMAFICTFTVDSVITSLRAMTLFDAPSVSDRKITNSRRDSLGRRRQPCPHSKFRASRPQARPRGQPGAARRSAEGARRLPCNHCFLGSHLLLEIPVSDGIEQPSERRPLAETEGGLPFGRARPIRGT